MSESSNNNSEVVPVLLCGACATVSRIGTDYCPKCGNDLAVLGIAAESPWPPPADLSVSTSVLEDIAVSKSGVWPPPPDIPYHPTPRKIRLITKSELGDVLCGILLVLGSVVIGCLTIGIGFVLIIATSLRLYLMFPAYQRGMNYGLIALVPLIALAFKLEFPVLKALFPWL